MDVLMGWVVVGESWCNLNLSYRIYTPAFLTSLLCFPSRWWEFSLDLGSSSWSPPLSCSWLHPLCFAANASAVKVTTTRCPPRGRHMLLEQTPIPRDVWLPYPLPPLTLNMLFALCAPLSFSVRLAAEISGMTPASGQRPRCGLLGAAEAQEGDVGWGASP